MSTLWLTCKQASRLQSQSMDRNLRLGERMALRIHLGICGACSKVAGQLEFLRRAMRAYPGPDDETKP